MYNEIQTPTTSHKNRLHCPSFWKYTKSQHSNRKKNTTHCAFLEKINSKIISMNYDTDFASSIQEKSKYILFKNVQQLI